MSLLGVIGLLELCQVVIHSNRVYNVHVNVLTDEAQSSHHLNKACSVYEEELTLPMTADQIFCLKHTRV